MELNKFIRYSRCPKRKCGIEVGTALLLGSVGGAVLGAGGSIAGSSIAASGAKDTNAQQIDFTKQENEKNREWQSAEADKNRQWQEQQWDYQFNKTFGSQLQQFRYEQDYINNYNSPQAQVRRLQDAGLNPALALGTGSTGTASSTPVSMTSPSTPSGSMPSSVGNAGINLENPGSYWGQGLANSFSAFANGFKQLVTSGPEGKKLAADAQKGLAEAVYLKSMKTGQDLQNIILKGSKDERLKQAILETQKMSNDVWLQGLKGTQMDAETDRIIQDTMVKKAEECLTYAKTDQQRQEIKAYFLNLKQQWSYWRGMSSAAQTSANAQMTTANSIKALNDSVIVLNQDRHVENLYDQLVKGIEGNNPNYSGTWHTSTEGGNSLASARRAYASALERQISENTELTPQQIKQAKYATEQLRVASSYAEMNAALGALGNAVGMVNATKMANAARLNAEAHSTSAGSYGRFCDEQIRRLNEGYNVRTRYVDKDGHVTGGWNQYHD